MISLSKRQADESQLIKHLRNDQTVVDFLSRNPVALTPLFETFAQSLSERYQSDVGKIQEALKHVLREMGRITPLSNRQAQKTITIPGTSDHAPRTIPVEDPPPNAEGKLTVDAAPAITKEQKVEDVSEAVTDDQESRQQQLVNSIKACKVVIQDLAKAMYGLSLTEDRAGDVVKKVIQELSKASADQTAETVTQLGSPLLGGS